MKIENKPGVYWWWMGSAVDSANILYNLKNFAEVGIGTVHIIPIYGVEGEEEKYIDFLSSKWMNMLSFTIEEARKLNLNVDMSTTTGWPFGGSHVTSEYAAKRLEYKIIHANENKIVSEKFEFEKIIASVAFSENNEKILLNDKIDSSNNLTWKVPKGNWKVYILGYNGTGQKVKRAAPGNEGLVLDPFSANGMNYYLTRYDSAFSNFSISDNFRAQYHDSYEYYNADYSDSLFKYFKKLNGYDLLDYLPILFGDSTDENTIRIKADYRKTISELHIKYISTWNNWAHKKGWITRNQAHGAPANLLDLYAASDIPETETFGSRQYKIPGIRFIEEENSTSEPPNPLVLKFASSAANVTGKKLVSSETATWLREHYKVSLSQIKPEIDELIYSGINHVFYHGSAYSPKEAEWPGWIFYASTHFEKENTIWKDLPALNKYVTNCQNILQSSQPDNDILLYWPIDDLFHKFPERLIKTFNVHNTEWFTNSDFGKIARSLESNGFSFDYISDKQLENVIFTDDKLSIGENSYHTIIIPQVKFIPLSTLKKLFKLANEGAKIIFNELLPIDIPGFFEIDKKREELSELVTQAESNDKNIIISNDLISDLINQNVRKENFNNKDLHFIRKKHKDGHYYFLSNFSDKGINYWSPLSVNFKSAIIINPFNIQDLGVAAQRENNNQQEIYLQLKPGQSCFVKTFDSKNVIGERWKYLTNSFAPIELKSNWKIEFIDGGPNKPKSTNMDSLISWTELNDEFVKSFAGTAKYSLNFTLPNFTCDNWLLNLGDVRESAKVYVNGNYIETLWSEPKEVLIGKFLKKEENLLEIEVTNLSANRIRDLDKNKKDWKKFFFVNIFYKKFDASNWEIVNSGLLGPITIQPEMYLTYDELIQN
ncbi:MAG: glycoside hydrolase [Ignavibacteriales bacterium]|nr:glycoside hydrolase [Ignavibacteriales bacterium]